MNTYTITAVNDQIREWESPKTGKKFKFYKATLRHPDGREKSGVSIGRPADDPAPTAGQSVEGTVKDTEHGPKLEEPRKSGAGGFNRAKSPEERRSIAMQSSLQRGIDIVRIAVEAGRLPTMPLGELTEQVLVASEKFYARVMKADAG